MDIEQKTPPNHTPVLKKLQTFAFYQAKRWSAVVLGIQTLLFIGGIVAIFYEPVSLSYPWFTVGFAIVGVTAAMRASYFRARAELLKRQHEFLDGLGTPPSAKVLANLRAEVPTDLEPRVQELLNAGITYASEAPAGLARLLANLCESAFFSYHLARLCAIYLLALIVFGILASLVVLLACLENLHSARDAVIAARAVAATIIFLISLGTIRSWWGYWSFSQRADHIHGEALKVLNQAAPEACETHHLLTEYQVARAGAPLIPTWLWARNHERLDQIWKDLNPTKANHE